MSNKHDEEEFINGVPASWIAAKLERQAQAKKHNDEPPRLRSNPTRIFGVVLYVGGMLASAAFFWNRWQTSGIHEIRVSKCHTIPGEPTAVIVLVLGALYLLVEALQGWNTGVERLPLWKYVVVVAGFALALYLLNRSC